MKEQLSVLFVCLGNICRSPTAQGVFERKLAESLLADKVSVDSAGTAAWHVGKAPDARSIAMAEDQGYQLGHLRARQAIAEDFHQFDYILAMDESNFADLESIKPADSRAELRLFLSFAPEQPLREVPDPYYNGEESFRQVIALVEQASDGLLEHLLTQDVSSGNTK